MKHFILFFGLLLSAYALSAQPYTNPNAIVDTFKKSIPCIAKGTAGGASIQINYYSPGVKKRVIWGGLVPFEQVWVTGAHNATRIELSKDVSVGGTRIKAGTYALFTIPGREEWIFILNKNYQQHLADNYRQEEDVVRIKVKPIAVETLLERLQYIIENGKLIIAWEKLKIEIPIIAQ